MIRRLATAIAMTLIAAHAAAAARAAEVIPLIDAHSRLPNPFLAADVISRMNAAGVRVTVLATEGGARPEDAVRLAEKHPGRIVPALRSNTRDYRKNRRKFFWKFPNRLTNKRFAALGAVVLFRAANDTDTSEIAVAADDARVRFLVDTARNKGWPFVVEMNVAGLAGRRDAFVAGLEAPTAAEAALPFVLLGRGGLEPAAVRAMIGRHRNLHFGTGRSDRSLGGTTMFDGHRLRRPWRDLVTAHPDRFVLAFGNRRAADWDESYIAQARRWHDALVRLAPDVAHAVAHGNAARLHGLTPLR